MAAQLALGHGTAYRPLHSRASVGANHVNSHGFSYSLTLAFFGNGFASRTRPVSPSTRLIGLTGCVFNIFGNLPGIIVPLVIGYRIHGADFAPALRGPPRILLVIGAASYIFLVWQSRTGGPEKA